MDKDNRGKGVECGRQGVGRAGESNRGKWGQLQLNNKIYIFKNKLKSDLRYFKGDNKVSNFKTHKVLFFTQGGIMYITKQLYQICSSPNPTALLGWIDSKYREDNLGGFCNSSENKQ